MIEETEIYHYRKQPFLKWPGGKRALLKHILPLMPKEYSRYFEPFAGGAALLFNLCPLTAVLSDRNADLINCYEQVRDHPKAIIKHLGKMKNNEKEYYRIRDSSPTTRIGRASRLIYLTTLSFNGIYRENTKGQFNVPYGHKINLNPCNVEKIGSASSALKNAILLCEDFRISLASAKKGDFIYLDPPYTVAHGNNGFLKYNDKIFSWNDQVRLADTARELAQKGCKVIISNADHKSIHELYKGFNLKVIQRASVIAASSSKRRLISECLIFN